MNGHAVSAVVLAAGMALVVAWLVVDGRSRWFPVASLGAVIGTWMVVIPGVNLALGAFRWVGGAL